MPDKLLRLRQTFWFFSCWFGGTILGALLMQLCASAFGIFRRVERAGRRRVQCARAISRLMQMPSCLVMLSRSRRRAKAPGGTPARWTCSACARTSGSPCRVARNTCSSPAATCRASQACTWLARSAAARRTAHRFPGMCSPTRASGRPSIRG